MKRVRYEMRCDETQRYGHAMAFLLCFNLALDSAIITHGYGYRLRLGLLYTIPPRLLSFVPSPCVALLAWVVLCMT